MTIERVRDPADPRVAAYRHLSDADLLQSHGLFVAEGRLVVRRIIGDGRYTVRSLLVNEAAARSLGPLLATLVERVPIFVCETADFLRLTGHDIHRGCLALVERPPALAVQALLESLEATAGPPNRGPADEPLSSHPRRSRRRDERGQRRRRVPQRRRVRRRRRLAEPHGLRSAVPKGHSHVDGGDASRASRTSGRLAARLGRAARSRLHHRGAYAAPRTVGAARRIRFWRGPR